MDMPPVIGIDMGWLFNMLLWFSCGWFFVYVILGPWIKVKLVNLRIGGDLRKNKRLVPVFISHLLFSLVLVNPFTLLIVGLTGGYIFNYRIWGVVLIVLYLGLLPILWECLLLRFISRWKGLKWLWWKPPLKRVVLVSLLLSMLSFGSGYGASSHREVKVAIVRTYRFCVLPKGYISIDTPGVKMQLRSGQFDKAKINPRGSPVKVSALVYNPQSLSIEAKKDDNTWRIYSSGPWGKLAGIKVKNNETTRLELGPPFLIKPTVSKSGLIVSIGLSIIGRAGEQYSIAIMKNGKGLAPPKLKIVDEAGNVLASGKFEYG